MKVVMPRVLLNRNLALNLNPFTGGNEITSKITIKIRREFHRHV